MGEFPGAPPYGETDTRTADQLASAIQRHKGEQLGMDTVPKAPCICCKRDALVDTGPLCGYCWRSVKVRRGTWPMVAVCHNQVWKLRGDDQ